MDNSVFDAEQIECSLQDYSDNQNPYDLDAILFRLDEQIDMLSCQADSLDYLIAISSGLVCGMLDVLWFGEINLQAAHEIGTEQVNSLVKKCAEMLGCKQSDDLPSSVRFLESAFPIPGDGSTPDFGGGLQHHLRNFGHHPTVIGLVFSLLTQFTKMSYGTDKDGHFIIVPVPERSMEFIGKTIPEKIIKGTITWFFHLVSDMAGSSSTAVTSGGTGLPGPLLATAKELSVLPFFRSMHVEDDSLSIFLSKLFNGTLLAMHDENGKIIKDSVLKFDLRTEMGLGTETASRAIPVIANECMVKCCYMIRRLGAQIRDCDIQNLQDLKQINRKQIRPTGNATITRMLTIATGVFTSVDLTAAIVTQKYWVAVNYPGVGRFAVAIGQDINQMLKAHNVVKIKEMYQKISENTFRDKDNRIYGRIENDMNDNINGFGLTVEQTEILYNLEYLKTWHDVQSQNNQSVKDLKTEWLGEWKKYMSEGFPSFVEQADIQLHWYSQTELMQKIAENNPQGTWYRLVLLEAMLFEPYYPLTTEVNKKGESVPGSKYDKLRLPMNQFNQSKGDQYLNMVFTGEHCEANYVTRLRKCYDKCKNQLNEVLKTTLVSVSVTAVIASAVIATAGMFAPAIAVALVGSNFAGLSGAALTSACLAYLGGGAIAVGGAGMAGGTIAIVGGGAILGVGVGSGVGGAVGAISIADKKSTINQSAKLMVSVREIFLNDEHNLELSNTIYEQYLSKIIDVEGNLTKLRLQADVAQGKEKKELTEQVKETEKAVEAMRIARKSMLKFQSAFETGTE